MSSSTYTIQEHVKDLEKKIVDVKLEYKSDLKSLKKKIKSAQKLLDSQKQLDDLIIECSGVSEEMLGAKTKKVVP